MKDLYRILKPNGIIVIANLSNNFSPMRIYLDHINKFFEKYGFVKMVMHIFSLIMPTIKIFYYNYLISKEDKVGKYSFFSTNEQVDLLKDAGFKNISKTEYHYSGQSVLNTALK
jgi:ubiquinone/menaquinone biosynthesis C-methylase UbiE